MAAIPIGDQGKELIRLCRSGQLYELEKRIAQGRAFDVPLGKKSLLQIAVETGFHSLVELISKNDPSQSSKNAALADAVTLRKLDFVEVLVQAGADIGSVPLVDVLLTWESRIMRFFLDRGADPVTGAPFAVAFVAKVQTALRAFLQYKQEHPEHAAGLQDQADRALRHFCYKGDLKWISLLLWAGGDPRSRGPCMEKDYTDDPENYVSALEEVSYSKSVAALKKLRPEASRDDLTELLRGAAVSGSKEMICYLLQIGAKPNDKNNGGSTAVDTCLWRLNFGFVGGYDHRPRSIYAVSEGLDCLRELVACGAIWNPDDQSSLNSLRKALYECEPAVTTELLRILIQHNASPVDRLKMLLDKPRMKEHLATQTWHLARIGLKYEEKKSSKSQPPPAHLVAQYDRADLYEKVWTDPIRNVAKQFGISDVWLAKICRMLQVPLPGRGYWAKRQAGRPTRKRPPLPRVKT